MHFFYFINVIVALFLSACASSETPHYILTDSQLHQYQGGDKLTYAALSFGGDNNDATGILTQTYKSVSLIAPESQTLNALARSIDIQGSIRFPFTTPNFTQMENGNLILQAYTVSDKTYWLTENKTATTGEVFYTSPLSEMTEQTNITSALLVCNREINTCENGGSTSLFLIPLGKETIETEYAKFDAYKFNISWAAIIIDNESGDSKAYDLSGTQWVYPPLGVVKFTYDLGTGIDTIIGTLSATNINIPSANKSDN